MKKDQATDTIHWYTETMKVDGFHEAFEWVTSGPALEIGYMYTGYKTTNAYLAHVLLYELIRLDKDAAPRSRVRADYEWTSEGLIHIVWIAPVTAKADNE